MSTTQPTRTHEWVKQFQTCGTDSLSKLGDNFQYYLDNVEEFESSGFEYECLPQFEIGDKMLIHSGVLFGIQWAHETAEPFVVSHPETGEFIGLYADDEKAKKHIGDGVTEYDEPDVVQVEIKGVDVMEELDPLLASDSDYSRKVGENLVYLFDHSATFDNGEQTADDMPHFSSNAKWLLLYSALFGRLWEYSHPSLWVCVDDDQRFDSLYSHPDDAKRCASSIQGGSYRVNIIDGDLPDEDVLSETPHDI